MSKRSSLRVIPCDEYDRLLEVCLKAREVLSKRREEVRNMRLTGVEVGRELLALQAHFAKTYSDLWKHMQHCKCCQSQAVGRDSRMSGQLHPRLYDGVPA